MTRRRAYAAAALLGALLLALLGAALVGAAPAGAATPTVTLSAKGPTPDSVTISVGDTVTFTNADLGEHFVKSTKTSMSVSWTYGPQSVESGKSQTTPAFTQPGTYTYSDQGGLLPPAMGTVVVQASTPSATPSATSTPSPRASSRASSGSKASNGQPKLGSAPATSAGASPTGAPALPSGLSPFRGGFLPPGSLPAGPPDLGPQLAPPLAGESPGLPELSESAVANATAGKGSVNNLNPQQAYGLPVALAVVGIGGAASLLVRVLLGHSGSGRRRAEARPVVTLR